MTGITRARMSELYKQYGDLGDVARASRYAEHVQLQHDSHVFVQTLMNVLDISVYMQSILQ